MSTEYHDDFASDEPLNAANVNTELGALDAQIYTNEIDIDAILAGTKAVDPAILFAEQGVAPATPATGYWKFYIKADGAYMVDDEGTETGPFGNAIDEAQEIDSKAKGTDGGNSIATSWSNVRTFTAEPFDDASIAFIFEPPSAALRIMGEGIFRIRASAPCYKGGLHKLIFYDYSNSAIAVAGFNAFCNTTDGHTRALLAGRFTVADPDPLAYTTYGLRHYITTSQVGDGHGIAVDIQDPDANDLTETYAVVELWRVAH